jgi:hypothetical protein
MIQEISFFISSNVVDVWFRAHVRRQLVYRDTSYLGQDAIDLIWALLS